MTRMFILLGFFSVGLMSCPQTFNDLFTTYESASTQPKYDESLGGYYNYNYGNNYVAPSYGTIDPDEFYKSIAPQNVQMVNGVFVCQGQLYSIKLKVGLSGLNHENVVVCGYWDGHCWNNVTSYASKIGLYGVPEQIRMACTYKIYISSVGTVFF